MYGEHGSASLPADHRLDLRFTNPFSLPAVAGMKPGGVCMVYVEGLNVPGIRNLLEYVDRSGLSSRYEGLANFSRRLLVAGFALSG